MPDRAMAAGQQLRGVIQAGWQAMVMEGNPASEQLAYFMAISPPNSQSKQLVDQAGQQGAGFLSAALPEPFGEVLGKHFAAGAALAKGAYTEAFELESEALNAFLPWFGKAESGNWSLPCLFLLNRTVRSLGESCDRLGGPQEKGSLTKAARLLQGSFSKCHNHQTSDQRSTRKWGTLPVVNMLIKVYFKLGSVRMCDNLIRAVENPVKGNANVTKEEYPLAHQTTYAYYTGRLAMFEDRYHDAARDLDLAFQHCPAAALRNKKLILQTLVPIKLMLGTLPKAELLVKYQLACYTDVCNAVRTGDLLLFIDSMRKHEDVFISMGVYLILEKVKLLVYRNLVKKVYHLKENHHQLPLNLFETAFKFCQKDESISLDETECIMSTLIASKYIKGYISHKQRMLVLSKKQSPFPPCSQVLGGKR